MKKEKKRSYKVEKSEFTKDQYVEILKKLNIKKSSLAREMGISYQTVKSWYYNNATMPMYAEKYLKRLLEIQEYESRFKKINSILNIPI